MKLVAGSVPEVGTNFVVDGDFESALGTNWNLTANFTSSVQSSTFRHLGSNSLHVVATAGGTGSGNAIYQDVSPLTNGVTYTLSFWYRQSTNGGPLTLRLSGATSTPAFNPAPAIHVAASTSTPGSANSVRATLPAFPTVWLNEAQAENLTGPTDNFGERDPWIELYNPGSNTVSLAGLYLGTNYSSPTLWAFPPAASIGPGQFLMVWADGQPQQTTGATMHANFRLPPGNGSVALSRFNSNALQIVDYLNYSGLPANYSYGDYPDGQPFYRQTMFHVTPGATNSIALPPISVSINEWMAGNTHTLANPIGGKFSDWFELYNYGTNTANLGGYYLTDTLTNQFKSQIPTNYTIPPHGFLLVWADSKPTNGVPDIHANFKLAKAGGSIGLYGPDGTAVDYVNYAAQTDDVSEGRYPDGGTLRLFMPVASPRAPNILPPAPTPPAVTGLALPSGGSGNVVLTFQTWPGHTYQVQYKDDLGAASWTPLGGGIFATDTQVQAADPNPSSEQRYYRVVQLN